ncbi:flavin reductase family protein [Mycobacterium sp. IDR2000157661]|uniref:flavin reductase family protein n=1 Tax=Mycobacterium sp. IDR2000157661 TaxID=2867005 RepID=UPI001EEA75C1|nr:flavin reductase family protein [Mycobacterium sp. IDR2000157661]ULE32631.1 flavin reductase family protein [Mycobacterium sp. IDR2000157661]
MIGHDEFRSAMRCLAAGVTIISTSGSEGPLGITATAVTSLTPDPASVLCCVNKNLSVSNAIRESRRFGLNVLRVEHRGLAARFAGMGGIRGTAKFGEGAWVQTASGVPALADSLVSLDCSLDRAIEAGTHHILIGLIAEVRIGGRGDPLVYCDGTFASLLAV